mmetsp:Transcript_3394/g.8033  ORF Transcript_3394/g.8033 Transcript_3394/m.8033 type:complete len:275 (+) Transcript_3394:468-1292(+)
MSILCLLHPIQRLVPSCICVPASPPGPAALVVALGEDRVGGHVEVRGAERARHGALSRPRPLAQAQGGVWLSPAERCPGGLAKGAGGAGGLPGLLDPEARLLAGLPAGLGEQGPPKVEQEAVGACARLPPLPGEMLPVLLLLSGKPRRRALRRAHSRGAPALQAVHAQRVQLPGQLGNAALQLADRGVFLRRLAMAAARALARRLPRARRHDSDCHPLCHPLLQLGLGTSEPVLAGLEALLQAEDPAVLTLDEVPDGLKVVCISLRLLKGVAEG